MILRAAAVQLLRGCAVPLPALFSLRSHYYSLRWRHRARDWPHPEAWPVATFMEDAQAHRASALRYARAAGGEGAGAGTLRAALAAGQAVQWAEVPGAGWHCSYFGGAAAVARKMAMITEGGAAAWREPARVARAVAGGLDIFGRDGSGAAADGARVNASSPHRLGLADVAGALADAGWPRPGGSGGGGGGGGGGGDWSASAGQTLRRALLADGPGAAAAALPAMATALWNSGGREANAKAAAAAGAGRAPPLLPPPQAVGSQRLPWFIAANPVLFRHLLDVSGGGSAAAPPPQPLAEAALLPWLQVEVPRHGSRVAVGRKLHLRVGCALARGLAGFRDAGVAAAGGDVRVPPVGGAEQPGAGAGATPAAVAEGMGDWGAGWPGGDSGAPEVRGAVGAAALCAEHWQPPRDGKVCMVLRSGHAQSLADAPADYSTGSSSSSSSSSSSGARMPASSGTAGRGKGGRAAASADGKEYSFCFDNWTGEVDGVAPGRYTLHAWLADRATGLPLAGAHARSEFEVVPEAEVAERYHQWYMNSAVPDSVRWMGVPTMKSVSDMWNYQEILFRLRPRLVVEFGTFMGGSALYFAAMLAEVHAVHDPPPPPLPPAAAAAAAAAAPPPPPFRVLTVDIERERIDARTKADPRIEVLTSSSAAPAVGERVVALRAELDALQQQLLLLRGGGGGGAGAPLPPQRPLFAILDSAHSKAHVLAELRLLTPLLRPGDYVIVEDTDINGHPVNPNYGPGPFEAVEEFLREQPRAYRRDEARERKFGWSVSPGGFLIRQ